jgi:hypothetical protein
MPFNIESFYKSFKTKVTQEIYSVSMAFSPLMLLFFVGCYVSFTQTIVQLILLPLLFMMIWKDGKIGKDITFLIDTLLACKTEVKYWGPIICNALLICGF